MLYAKINNDRDLTFFSMEVGEEEAAMREREGRQQSFFEREGERGQEVVQGVDACYSLLRWGVE